MGRREGEKHQCVIASYTFPQLGTYPATQACALTGNQTNYPFGSQASAQSTELHQPGFISVFMLLSHPKFYHKVKFLHFRNSC